MDLRSLFLGSKLKVVATALGLVVASVGGAFALGAVGAPAVVGVENRFGPVSNETTVVETDLLVENPNPIGVRLGGTTVNYTVKMNEVDIATGEKEGLAIEAGTTTLAFQTEMRNEKIPRWWVTHVRNDEVTDVTVDARVRTSILGGRQFDLTQNQRVETDVIGQFNSNETRPVNGPSNPVYSNPVLYVNRTRGAWGNVTSAETPIDMSFTVYNPQSKPYTVSEVGYEITMNGVGVGSGTTERTYIIPGRATRTIETRPAIRNQRLDDWWVTHLENDQVTELRIDFYAKIDLPTGQQIRVPLDRLTYERTIETDIFGTKSETDGDGSTPTRASPDGQATSTPGGDSPTATPAPTPDGGSPTESDDGILGLPARAA